MAKKRSSRKRNVEQIRQKNLEDNRLFLEQLLVNHVRKDFVSSARSILRKDGNDQIRKAIPHSYEKVERNTRYNAKVKSGEITPHVPDWQRKGLEKEQRQQERELERQKMKLEKEQRRKEKELQRQKENELRRQKKELERQEKLRERQMEREEVLFEQALKKIESQIKFEESIRMKRDERHRRYGFHEWELPYQDQSQPYQHRYSLRHTDTSE